MPVWTLRLWFHALKEPLEDIVCGGQRCGLQGEDPWPLTSSITRWLTWEAEEWQSRASEKVGWTYGTCALPAHCFCVSKWLDYTHDDGWSSPARRAHRSPALSGNSGSACLQEQWRMLGEVSVISDVWSDFLSPSRHSLLLLCVWEFSVGGSSAALLPVSAARALEPDTASLASALLDFHCREEALCFYFSFWSDHIYSNTIPCFSPLACLCLTCINTVIRRVLSDLGHIAGMFFIFKLL